MWREHDMGVVAGGDVGDDAQMGESFGRRFVHDGLPGSMVTVHIYPVGHYEGDNCSDGSPTCRPDNIELAQQVDYLICTDPQDPGGTATWSDCTYTAPLDDVDGAGLNPENLVHAQIAARRLLDAWTADRIRWDGVSTDARF